MPHEIIFWLDTLYPASGLDSSVHQPLQDSCLQLAACSLLLETSTYQQARVKRLARTLLVISALRYILVQTLVLYTHLRRPFVQPPIQFLPPSSFPGQDQSQYNVLACHRPALDMIERHASLQALLFDAASDDLEKTPICELLGVNSGCPPCQRHRQWPPLVARSQLRPAKEYVPRRV